MNRLLNNTSWIMFNQIFQMIIGFFVGLFTVRYLGPANYGSITYIASYVSFFSAVCLMGLDTVVVNRLVYYKDRDGEVIASAIFLRTMASLICMACLSTLVMIVDHGDHELMIVAVLSGFELFFKAFGTIGFWYQYKLWSKRTVIADMIAFVIATVYRIYLLASGKGVYWFAFYNSFVFLLIALFYIPLFKKDCESKIFISKEMCMDLLKACVPYLISGVMISLYSQVDRIMIKQMLNSTEEVGYYSAAAMVCNLIAFIPNSISLSARPVLMDMKRCHSKDYNKRVTQVLATIIWFSILYSIFVVLFSNVIIIVLYGEAYLAASYPLRILIWVTIVENLTKIRDMWLIGENQSKFVTLFSCTGTVLNILINFALIPKIGILGAAIATVITQFSVTLIVPALFKETRGYAVNVLHAIFLKDVNVHELVNEVKAAIMNRGAKND